MREADEAKYFAADNFLALEFSAMLFPLGLAK